MKQIPTEIPDVVLVEPSVYEDPRGFFFESYNQGVFEKLGIPGNFIQDNHVCSSRGVLRGLHFQIEPKAQAKIVRVVRGEIFDVAVDIRKGSTTFGKSVSVMLSAENKRILYIPVGFAHGYLSLTEGTEVLYKVSNVYSPEHERGISWKDPSIGITWPSLGMDYILSEKDQKLPHL